MLKEVRNLVLNEIKELLPWVDVQQNYINIQKDLPLKKPLITVSKAQLNIKEIGMDKGYLGLRFTEDKVIETRAKDAKVYFDVHIWNADTAKLGGEDTIQTINEELIALFLFNPDKMPGFKVLSFDEGSTSADPHEEKEKLFHCRNVLELNFLWKKEFEYEIIDEVTSKGDVY